MPRVKQILRNDLTLQHHEFRNSNHICHGPRGGEQRDAGTPYATRAREPWMFQKISTDLSFRPDASAPNENAPARRLLRK
jgi:hypothetical protein